jgi:hypothetical protein
VAGFDRTVCDLWRRFDEEEVWGHYVTGIGGVPWHAHDARRSCRAQGKGCSGESRYFGAMTSSIVSIQAHAYNQNHLTENASVHLARISLDHIPTFSSAL